MENKKRWFCRLYRWAMIMKSRAALYLMAGLLMKCVISLAMGEKVVNISTAVEMFVAALIFATIETVIFPDGMELSYAQMVQRSVCWLVLGNLIFWGGGWFLGWFAGAPTWVGWMLVVWLQIGLGAVWFGVHVALKVDTDRLNDSLHRYQDRVK